MELQELYIYQQQLRVDLEDKLLSTEVCIIQLLLLVLFF